MRRKLILWLGALYGSCLRRRYQYSSARWYLPVRSKHVSYTYAPGSFITYIMKPTYFTDTICSPGVDSGNCRQLPDGWGRGCGIFLEGPSDCKGMGDDMWWGAQQIRGNNCRACGFKTFTGERGGACRLTINYVTGCNN